MSIDLRQTHYLLSAVRLEHAPPDTGFEVAFAGRSNAGKSSALNTLTGRNGLARTSKTPGRTQAINFFVVDEQRRLVDLPGYGFAKVPEAIKRQWGVTMGHYLSERQSLRGLILLMDVRHPLNAHDRQMLEWATGANLPVHILLTKSDKLKSGAASASLLQVRKALKEIGGNNSAQLFSSLKKTGVDEARAVLDRWLEGAEA